MTAGPEHPDDLQRVALSPDGTQALSCDVAGVTRLYDVDFEAGAITELAAVAPHERCTRVAWSPSGELGLSVGHEGYIVLYRIDGESLSIADIFEAEEETGEAIFGRDDTEVVAGSFGTLNTLWHLEVNSAGQLAVLQTLQDNSGIGALEWSHNDALLLTGEHDDSIRIMERGGAGLITVGEVRDDGAGVHSARWSPDDRWVARTGSNRDLLQVLEVGDCSTR
ncbi:MAG: WD40 repeat protein [Cognaticolwellia sp.]